MQCQMSLKTTTLGHYSGKGYRWQTGISALTTCVPPTSAPRVPASQERIGSIASATSRAPVFSHSSSAPSTRSHFSPNDVHRRHHHHPFSIMRDSGPWCLFPPDPLLFALTPVSYPPLPAPRLANRSFCRLIVAYCLRCGSIDCARFPIVLLYG